MVVNIFKDQIVYRCHVEWSSFSFLSKEFLKRQINSLICWARIRLDATLQ